MPKQEEYLEIKPKWPLEDNLMAIYANQFAITQYGPEIVVTFGEFLPTGLAGRPEAEVEEYLNNASVKPLAKVVMTPAGLEALYGLLKGYMDRKQTQGG
jgi:hypothetical protein